MSNELLLIYRSRREEAEPTLRAALGDAESAGLEVTEVGLPAAVGNLAGTAISVLVSSPVQAFLNVVALGAVVLGIIKAARGVGRRLLVSKDAARYLGAERASKCVALDPPREPFEPDAVSVIGPMAAVPLIGFPPETCESTEFSGSRVSLVAFAFPWHRKRVRTYWYLISDTGDTISSWYTQTLSERLQTGKDEHGKSRGRSK
jgi:hypothetical protein